uniref:Odorant binding protein 29 n=1 Tax=Holotrichia parallela TaxID=93412 RepID=A0A0S2UY29_HOLPA|nr:odorant binding protein 29 [Holotrichia parallela]
MTKVVLLFVVFIVAVQAKKKLSQDEIKQINQNCLKSSEMDSGIIKNIVSYDTFPKPSDKYTKYLECMYVKQGYLDEDGLISYETIEDFILDFYDFDTVKSAIEPCIVLQEGKSGGERAYNAAKCLIRNLESLEKRQEKEHKDITGKLA